jgi:protoporphyrinogen oxidase
MTRELLNLLGSNLQKVEAPSQIYHDGKFIGFPLSLFDLTVKLGPVTILKAGLELIHARMRAKDGDGSFESFATRMYGKTLARLFLLNYSEKLWGKPGATLSPHISGRRLKGLDLATFLKETFPGRGEDSNHLEGSFYYPKGGYVAIVDKLAEVCGEANIRTNSRITKIFHNEGKIHQIEINNQERIAVDEVVSTLPLPLFVRILEPEPDTELIDAARTLRFRNLILVASFLDREKVSDNATLYVSDPSVPITRIYEPKNRSEIMAPPGKTSLCEIPCDPGDHLWKKDDNELIALTRSELIKLKLVTDGEISGSVVHRMSNAYPILDLESENTVDMLLNYSGNFRNLRVSGRNGRFLYTSMLDMLKFGSEVIDDLNPIRDDRN